MRFRAQSLQAPIAVEAAPERPPPRAGSNSMPSGGHFEPMLAFDVDRDRMTILTVRHLTTYSYAAPVRLGEHRMMLRPRDSNDQRLLEATP